MAKHVILENYTFTPSTKTIVVNGKNIRREQLLLITNVTAGTVIYNFSDPALQASSFTNSVNSTTGQETTTIIVNYATGSMNASDKLSILVEETYNEIIPAEVMRDPVDKLRVSTPQSLIDTDFEYGLQPTKWEQILLLNGRPSAFYDSTQALSGSASTPNFPSASGSYTISNITASGKTVTVAINNTNGITVGLPIFVTGTLDNGNADGWWIVETVSANTNFTYTTTNTPAAALFDSNKSYLFIGSFYTGAAIPVSASAGAAFTNVSTTVTGTTTNDHGLRPGDAIYVVGTTASTNAPNGSWIIATTPTNNTFTFVVNNAPTGTITASGGASATLYPRSLGYSVHRPFDGGVQFSNVTPYHGYQLIRQTRRQFRYQSGKGMQFSTGSILKPALNVDTITSSGTTVTVTTKYTHGLLPGAIVIVSGCTETAYNGTFTVVTAATPTTFTYTALSTPSASPATGTPSISPSSWYGGSNRVGMFDHQNGFYFEFDGQTLYAVRRSSTFQISGVSAVTNGSQTVTGTNTKFSSQLKPGDWIVIRGMSYLVQQITSDTAMYIYPEYRGSSGSACVISKTVNTRYAQSTWNIDKMDGTGVSQMNLDLTKMQMFYIDFSWYGAGAIRFGFKNNRGEVNYCHRISNSNVNTEAYMRSGNMVARYETNTLPYSTYLTATLSSAATTGATISVADTTGFAPTGTVVITSSAATGAVKEYITYTAKTATTLTIGSRAQTGGQASAQTFTYSATAPIMVEVYSPQQSSTISHWGSAVIMDGRYDDDKAFQFNYGMNSQSIFATAGTRYPVFSVRLAPTVDNGFTGVLGQREIINRMQLTPAAMSAFVSTSSVRVELILNGRVSSSAANWVPVGGSSLAQYANHGTAASISGGESIFTFFSPAGAVNTEDLTRIRDIGNSILGGGTNNTVSSTPANIYPDGPDVLTVALTPLSANAWVAARLSWTEAQA
jgi:hypothetical protein